MIKTQVLVAIVFEGAFGSKVIKAVGFGAVIFVVGLVAVFSDYWVTLLGEFKANFPAEFDDVPVFSWKEFEQVHERGFAGTDRAG